jgi:hypothetical protein
MFVFLDVNQSKKKEEGRRKKVTSIAEVNGHF